jgi:serine/threonine protein phosphatase PrpC
MLRVAEQYAATDTGRQRRANEDALLSRSPLFVVADGMGGAQAGEVASKIAVEAFKGGLADSAEPESALADLTQKANSRIHELSHSHTDQAGMGTTLTAMYVGEQDVSIAHVGDSRAYCLRASELIRLTDDHSLVDELLRQGRLTPEEAEEHPQRSVITRALGPEGTVEVDTRSFRALAGDVYLLCSDGLTTMVSEEQLASLLRGHASLRDAGEALISAANEAGGRDNITVLLVRLEEVSAGASAPSPPDAGPAREDSRTQDLDATIVGAPAVSAPAVDTPVADAPAPSTPVLRRRPRAPQSRKPGGSRRMRVRRAGGVVAALVVLALLGSGIYVALRSVYFVGTNGRGLITLYRGVPFKLPGNVPLYSSDFVSGVSASTVLPARRRALLDHSLRSEANAAALIRSLELGQLE